MPSETGRILSELSALWRVHSPQIERQGFSSGPRLKEYRVPAIAELSRSIFLEKVTSLSIDHDGVFLDQHLQEVYCSV